MDELTRQRISVFPEQTQAALEQAWEQADDGQRLLLAETIAKGPDALRQLAMREMHAANEAIETARAFSETLRQRYLASAKKRLTGITKENKRQSDLEAARAKLNET